jgi:hypothetical protein
LPGLLTCKLDVVPITTAVLGRAALAAALAGAAASLALMLYAGRRNPSWILALLFAAWVLSPFVAAVLALTRSRRWSAVTRAALQGTLLAVSLLSVFVYGAVALGRVRAKVGFIFLVVPFVSWLLLVIAVAVGAAFSRGSAGRQVD